MYLQEKIKPYSQEGEKSQQVEQMFDNIAPSYDALNHRLSWNIDRYWRRRLLSTLKEIHINRMLDVATGTGDLAIKAAEKLDVETIVGIDLSDEMLKVARRKACDRNLQETIKFEKADCLNLKYADNTFDAVVAAFGIRNFQQLDRGLEEMLRVMKPGGRLRIIELTTPKFLPARWLFWLYTHTWLPFYGRIVSKDNSAYQYLTDTIEAFPQGETMMQIMQKAGFRNTTFKRLTFGICTLYLAEK